MVRKAKDVTDAELAILKLLWEQPEVTVRQIADQLYPKGGDSEYATVKKLLARLESKKFVARNRQSTAHTFVATLSRDELLGRRLDGLAENLCEGSSAPLLMHLIRNSKISSKQQDQLRQLIQDLSDKPSRKKKG